MNPASDIAAGAELVEEIGMLIIDSAQAADADDGEEDVPQARFVLPDEAGD